MSNKYILNLHYDDVESSLNPCQIHIELISNPHRIDIESFCRFDVEILIEILVESLSNPYRIDVKFTSNQRRILIELTSNPCRFDIEILVKILVESTSNPYRTLIDLTRIRRRILVDSTLNPRQIDVEHIDVNSTSNPLS